MLSLSGCVKCWGQNTFRQLGNSKRTQQMIECIGEWEDNIWLKTNVSNHHMWLGCLQYTHISEPQPTECVDFGPDFVALDIEAYHRSTCAIGADNAVICWVRCIHLSSFSHFLAVFTVYFFFFAGRNFE